MSIFSPYKEGEKIDMEPHMALAEQRILREPREVDPRLKELGLKKKGLLDARDIARHEASNATPFHAANAAGTYAYHGGTWALRDRFVGKEWSVDRVNGVEAIRNEKLKVIVAFSNVDLACVDDHCPQPRTRKGSGAERAMGGGLFAHLPQYVPQPAGEWSFYYLMVDENSAAELTRPIVKGGKFVTPIERIYLSYGSDDDGSKLLESAPTGPVAFEPQVARK